MKAYLFAAAGWAENAARSIKDGNSVFLFIVFLASFVAANFLAYLLIQRFAEVMLGRWRTTTRELLGYTLVFAALCAILVFIRMHGS